MTTHTETIRYNDGLCRQFSIATLVWGVVGMLVGVLIASQLAFPQLNFAPYLTFGRLRPLHTNAVIFAFVGNSIFAGMYYSTQRLLKARLASDWLGAIHFWGWQLIIVAAALTLPLGLTQGKEYAELEWPIDLAVVVVWVVFAINFFWTIAKRREKHLYVALWFYIATIITVAVLYIVNNLAIPLSLGKSYSIFGGVQDALVQWWYGHNAVAFFLTTPVLGIMYYFVPKALERPIYSYRLSIIHFWALVFMYIWAGPHHLLNTALPDWAQNLGMVFSVALWAPSWGGMINGLLTLRGAWEKLRTDPVIKFFVAGLTFYGMTTFEGPLLSIKSVNALAHGTDWIIGHVHMGGLGWNGFMAAGMLYWMVPRLFGTKLYSEKLANLHFWLGLFGILLYVAAMYVSGLTQGLMLRAVNDAGALQNPNFLESVIAIRPMLVLRVIGGSMYLAAFVMMVVNLCRTARSGVATDGEAIVVVIDREAAPIVGWERIVFSPTMGLVVVGLTLMFALAIHDLVIAIFVLLGGAGLVVASYLLARSRLDRPGGASWHEVLESRPLIFTVFVLVAILIGGMVQIIPTVTMRDAVPLAQVAHPYTALELQGRDIYVREGCYNCHTQMIRALPEDALRYGAPSRAWESIQDHPFQWGSRRAGPDLARIGGKYPDVWHYKHLLDPQSTSVGSFMPQYPHFARAKIAPSTLSAKLQIMQTLGVPYDTANVQNAASDAQAQGERIARGLAESGVHVAWDDEVVAVIAYLQELGLDGRVLERGE